MYTYATKDQTFPWFFQIIQLHLRRLSWLLGLPRCLEFIFTAWISGFSMNLCLAIFLTIFDDIFKIIDRCKEISSLYDQRNANEEHNHGRRCDPIAICVRLKWARFQHKICHRYYQIHSHYGQNHIASHADRLRFKWIGSINAHVRERHLKWFGQFFWAFWILWHFEIEWIDWVLERKKNLTWVGFDKNFFIYLFSILINWSIYFLGNSKLKFLTDFTEMNWLQCDLSLL